MLRMSLELLSVVPEPPPSRPLIYMGGARRFTESRDRLINVSGSVSTLSILQYKFTYQCQFMSMALNWLWALGLHKASPSVFMGFGHR